MLLRRNTRIRGSTQAVEQINDQSRRHRRTNRTIIVTGDQAMVAGMIDSNKCVPSLGWRNLLDAKRTGEDRRGGAGRGRQHGKQGVRRA